MTTKFINTNEFIFFNTNEIVITSKEILESLKPYLSSEVFNTNPDSEEGFDESQISEIIKLYSFRILTYYMDKIHKCGGN